MEEKKDSKKVSLERIAEALERIAFAVEQINLKTAWPAISVPPTSYPPYPTAVPYPNTTPWPYPTTTWGGTTGSYDQCGKVGEMGGTCMSAKDHPGACMPVRVMNAHPTEANYGWFGVVGVGG